MERLKDFFNKVQKTHYQKVHPTCEFTIVA